MDSPHNGQRGAAARCRPRGGSELDAYVDAMRRYAQFSGRAGRGQYWGFVLVSLLITAMLTLIFGIVSPDLGQAAYGVAVLGHALPSLAVGARRLHDSGRSGWWQLVGLVPVIGLVWLIVLLVLSGDRGANRFGDDPAAAHAWPGSPDDE
jgi:uncharacterized membrane protein YhaH (DUF805 family)